MRFIERWSLLVPLVLCYGMARGQGSDRRAVLPKSVSEKTCAVRFVYNPPIPQNNIVIPLILRQTTKQDSRYGEWSVLVPEGVTQWISPVEMEGVEKGLRNLNLKWSMSKEPISFAREEIRPAPPSPELPWKMPMARHEGTMEIDITTGSNSFVADLSSKDVCEAMQRLDSAFRIPIALFNFRWKMVGWGCKVPGFNPANRPEHSKDKS